ncbi:hypothetical protein [Ralstonia phage RSP15]|uniref:hypothetical protein n=1 Tax=Ralstonia phage RSP15 TaxID=1785960 RepID=UPI00074D2BCB|nr:hypothetical protein BH754_gp068 [Ralstonia phage RSP15]BAU40026.1 hypothetical protein [Ralstonia phage RSP15]
MIKAISTIVAIKKFIDYVDTFNNMAAPAGNLGIPRWQMPQIEGKNYDDFLNWLKGQGISNTKKTVSVGSLNMTQSEFNKNKVMKLMGGVDSAKPILVSSDGYVLDGTHRFLAEYNKGRNRQIAVYQINKPIRDLLKIVKNYSKAVFRKVNGETLP